MSLNAAKSSGSYSLKLNGLIGGLMDKLFATPIKAIRKKCLDCTCGQLVEIRECPVINCSLYPYRMGRRPDQTTIDTIKEYYEEE